jgi:hypothetical protein
MSSRIYSSETSVDFQQTTRRYIHRSILPLIMVQFCSPECDASYFSKYCYGDQMKGNGMGGACNTHGNNAKCMQNFSWNPEEITSRT